MLKTVVQLNTFVKVVILFFQGFFDEKKVQKNIIYWQNILSSIFLTQHFEL